MNADEIVRALRRCKSYKTKVELQATMISAADCVESMQAQLSASQRREKAAVNDMTACLKRDSDDICGYCKHKIECKGQDCDDYCSGTGDIDGKYPDWKWTCEDFDFGTCAKMESTPCNGCFENDCDGFEWRGPEAEKGDSDGAE